MVNVQLIRNLKLYRDAYGYTQEWLSQQLSISRQAYSNYERGKREPDLDLLIQLCKIYDITLDQLIHRPPTSYNLMVHETKTAYTTAAETESEAMLYLTQEEVSLLLNYREADEETRHIVDRLLQTK